jgi:hypothetical protein
MDIQKASNWSNIGMFVIAVIVLLRDSFREPANGLTMSNGLFVVVFLLVLSGGMHLAAAIINRPARKVVGSTLATRAAPSSELTSPIIPPERIFVPLDVTVGFLRGLIRNKTRIHAEKAISFYIGRWMTVSGKVREVSSATLSDDFSVRLEGSTDASDGAIFMFFDSKWASHLSILNIGSEISALGQIDNVDISGLWLINCEPRLQPSKDPSQKSN